MATRFQGIIGGKSIITICTLGTLALVPASESYRLPPPAPDPLPLLHLGPRRLGLRDQGLCLGAEEHQHLLLYGHNVLTPQTKIPQT